MLISRLTYPLILAISALCGRAEPSTVHALDSDSPPALELVATPAQSGQVHLAPRGPTDLLLCSRDTSKLDDEVEVPDEEEDDKPDDPGQALDPDDRPVPPSAHVDAPNPELLAPAARPHGFEGVSDGRECPRFLSLCRFLC
jgi:hypothetical protein